MNVSVYKQVETSKYNNLNHSYDYNYYDNSDFKKQEVDSSSESIGKPESFKNRLLTWEENEQNLNETLSDFDPNFNVTGEYLGDEIEGEIDEGLNITIPNQGLYNINGSISQLESQYIQNPGAELDQDFYSYNAIQAGLSLERIKDNRSIEGEYVWKFYSNNTESMIYSLYQENIDLYSNDTTITYDYLLESNSSIQNVLNSSFIVDFVFDTCRIMIVHWHYTNINPPLIGENTTIPFIVFRLLRNSSWDDQWNSNSLSLSELFNPDDPYIPNTLKSVGFYIVSPEISECSILIDNFKIRTSLLTTDVNLTINDFQVNSTGLGVGSISILTTMTEEQVQMGYQVTWNFNSSFTINAKYNLLVSGIVNISFEKSITVYGENIVFNVSTSNLDSQISRVNISYPDFWSLLGEIQGWSIISNISVEEGYNLLSLLKIGQDNYIYCKFKIQNLVEDVYYESLNVFESVNATFVLKSLIADICVNVFWFAEDCGSAKFELLNNNLNFVFPPWINNGSVDLTFIIIKNNNIGYSSVEVLISRLPSELNVIDLLSIPLYAFKKISIEYESLITEFDIQEARIYALLDNESILVNEEGGNFQLCISAFYLEEGDYTIQVYANSTSHASLFKEITLNIYSSPIIFDFDYQKLEEYQHYQLNFNISSDAYPISYAPIMIEVKNNTISGVTNDEGSFSCDVTLSIDTFSTTVLCSLTKTYNVIASESFEIIISSLCTETFRSEDNVIISKNITITYSLHYPTSYDKWFSTIEEEMLPIIDAYIEAESLRIPVSWNSDYIYWQIQANKETSNHKLVIVTTGPEYQALLEKNDNTINVHFTISSTEKDYSNLSIIYYFNISITSAKYDWRLFTSGNNDISDIYDIEINDLYAYIGSINITKGSYLILELIGSKTSNSNQITNIVVPLVSSSGILLGVVTAIMRVYNKKKGLILEI
ncbi:MAG: hypothetical protein ACFFDS_01830 [Candidatus Thorarchaeota archaeon]